MIYDGCIKPSQILDGKAPTEAGIKLDLKGTKSSHLCEWVTQRKLIKPENTQDNVHVACDTRIARFEELIPVRTLTIALFALGGLIAAVAIFQQFTIASKPYTISHEEAVRIALNEVNMEPDRDVQVLPHAIAEATLIHIGQDGWSFLVDENSLGDKWAFRKDSRFEKYVEEYVWYVEVTISNINGGSRGYWYLIDVDSGRAIGNGSDVI